MSKKLFNNMQEVYEYCKSKLVKEIWQRVGNREDAEDVTSDIFTEIVAHCEWFIKQDENHQANYLALIKNKVLDRHNLRASSERTVDFSGNNYLEKLISEDRLVFMEEDEVRTHFNVLTETERRTAEKKFIENKSISQIALEENANANTIAKRLSRAKNKMKK